MATVLESLYLTSDSFDPYGINVEHFRLNGAPTELDVAYEILRDGMYSMHALSIEEAHD